ncbi:lipocalin family protein [Alistipes sp.]|uniref:lipocalin family protein n=1 Tax=Alistipes sp. TaxID=1872444 RepID=UPI0025C3D656|nr:lipocalin family protein [Alistipes sp.]
MKKYLYHLLVFSLLGIFAASCSDDDNTPNIHSEIVGQWRLTSWTENAPEGFEVYVEFSSEATFMLYQKVETSNYTKYTGRYSIDGSRLTGVYDDGETWGKGYDFELTNDGNTLTMVSRTEPAETSVYSRTIIPDDVRNAATSRAGSSPEMKRML